MEKESTSGEEKKWTHVSIQMNKWKYNRVNLYTNNPLSFPPAKIYSSIYHQPESRQFSHSLNTLWQSFVFEFHFVFWQFFFFQQKVKNFCCSRFLKFLVRTNFCNLPTQRAWLKNKIAQKPHPSPLPTLMVPLIWKNMILLATFHFLGAFFWKRKFT